MGDIIEAVDWDAMEHDDRLRILRQFNDTEMLSGQESWTDLPYWLQRALSHGYAFSAAMSAR